MQGWTSAITANAAGAACQWLDFDAVYAIISGETAQCFTASTNGDYAVEVTTDNCTDTSACTTITTVGMTETSGFNAVFIYPNPIQEMLHIQLGALTDRKSLIRSEVSTCLHVLTMLH